MAEEEVKDLEEPKKEKKEPREETEWTPEKRRGKSTYEERMSVLKRRVRKLKATISDEAKAEANSK